MKRIKGPLIIIGLGLIILLISQTMEWRWDLTGDKRFSLSTPVESLVEEYGEIVLIESLFKGDFPSNYTRLEESVEDLLRRMRKINPRINYRLIDPLDGSTEEVSSTMKQFSEMGLTPFPIRYESDREFKAVQAFPYVVFTVGQKNVVVNILEANTVGENTEAGINKAIAQLEYKFANALKKLTQDKRRNIGILTGHGEFGRNETLFMERELRRYYTTSRIDLDSVGFIPDEIDLLMVLAPEKTFSERHLFYIDEYVARGGSIIWMVERFKIKDDSLNTPDGFTPIINDPGLESLFFKYGVRFNNNLVVDLECSNTSIVTATPSGQPQIEKYPWFYHILAQPSPDHIITNNLDRVNMFYPSSIELLPVNGVEQTTLLASSPRSRVQPYPFVLTFEILKYPVREDEFNAGPQPVAVIEEGTFPSYFQNRLPEEYRQALIAAGKPSNLEPKNALQIFISDADFSITRFTPQSGEPLPIGYNMGERSLYSGNESFLLNMVEYAMEDGDILMAKSKERKLYLLDDTKANNEKGFWRSFNVLLPLIILLIFGFAFNFYRRYKFTRR
jgi:ABC-2 type transport system permease protein